MTQARARCIYRSHGLVLLLSLAASAATAQTADVQMDVVYECPGSVTFRVFSCAGPGAADQCDVEVGVPGQPAQRGPSTRQQIMTLVPLCRPQTAGQAPSAPGAAGAAPAAGPDKNGFTIGEEVNAATAGGWYAARILRANGDAYYVRFGPSTEAWKNYPTELRRLGPLTDMDRARGLFAMGEKVQVNVEGQWIDGEIVAEMGMEYNVQLANNRSAWASAQNMRRVAAAAKPAPTPGTPPRPGLTSCAGKIEGRYASTSGGAGATFQIVFRSGKATMRELGGDSEFECWMDGERIYLHTAGASTDMDMPIDINNDGTLETPLGELKKKGN
jgi:hypothetical protein